MIYERTPAMMHAVDAEGRLLRVSDLWLERMGYAREEVIGRRLLDFLTEDARRHVEPRAGELRFPGAGEGRPLGFVKKNGDVLEVGITTAEDRDAEGKLLAHLAVLSDVSERLRMERVLRESEERYRSLVEQASFGIVVHRSPTIVYANQTVARLVGAASPTELVGRDVLDLVHPDCRDFIRRRIQHAQASGVRSPITEQVWVRLDGTTFEVEASGVPIVYDGAPAIQVVVQDIEQRKQAEEARRRSLVQEEMLRAHEAALRALSTPLIPVSDEILVMPLIGQVDAVRAQGILEALLAGVTAHRASCAILDVTGVPEATAVVAEGLVRAASAVRLLGAEVILTGIKPAVAQALVAMGAELGALVTLGTLESGIAYAMNRRRSPRGEGQR